MNDNFKINSNSPTKLSQKSTVNKPPVEIEARLDSICSKLDSCTDEQRITLKQIFLKSWVVEKEKEEKKEENDTDYLMEALDGLNDDAVLRQIFLKLIVDKTQDNYEAVLESFYTALDICITCSQWTEFDSQQQMIMREFFLQYWDEKKEIHNTNGLLATVFDFLNKDVELRQIFFRLIRERTDNYEIIFKEFLILIKIQTTSLNDFLMLKKIWDMSISIIETIHSRIHSSFTAIRVSISNQVPPAFRKHMVNFFKICKEELNNKNYEIENIPQKWNEYLNHKDNAKFQQILGDNAKEIEYKLCVYYKLLFEHRKYLSEVKSIHETLHAINYLNKLIPTRQIVCKGMAYWVCIKLILSGEIDTSFKKRIKIYSNGIKNPHMFIGITDSTEKQLVFVIDPWLKYVDTSVDGKKYNSLGFIGVYTAYQGVFDQIADGETLEKMENPKIHSGFSSLTQEEVEAFDQL